jgi:hypothetical protein
MNEAETRAEHIDPALKAAGWGVVAGSRIRRKYLISPGRLEGRGRHGKPLIADYVLEYRNTKLAVDEAKAWDEALAGLGCSPARPCAASLLRQRQIVGTDAPTIAAALAAPRRAFNLSKLCRVARRCRAMSTGENESRAPRGPSRRAARAALEGPASVPA